MRSINNIKRGDKVTVELVATGHNVDNGIGCRSPTGGWCYSIERGDIVGHAPREIKVGDEVIWPIGEQAGILAVVLGIDDKRAWVRSRYGTEMYTTMLVTDLRTRRDPIP